VSSPLGINTSLFNVTSLPSITRLPPRLELRRAFVSTVGSKNSTSRPAVITRDPDRAVVTTGVTTFSPPATFKVPSPAVLKPTGAFNLTRAY
jgi:hypothetical protein